MKVELDKKQILNIVMVMAHYLRLECVEKVTLVDEGVLHKLQDYLCDEEKFCAQLAMMESHLQDRVNDNINSCHSRACCCPDCMSNHSFCKKESNVITHRGLLSLPALRVRDRWGECCVLKFSKLLSVITTDRLGNENTDVIITREIMRSGHWLTISGDDANTWEYEVPKYPREWISMMRPNVWYKIVGEEK